MSDFIRPVDVILNAFDFGVPQHRKRWFGVFTRDLDPDPGKPVTAMWTCRCRRVAVPVARFLGERVTAAIECRQVAA